MLEPVHFLLVDDLVENLLSLEALLRRDDLVLLKARSGEEALELLLRHDVALALLDVQMPGMDGFELAEFMRGNPRTSHVPIIFVTAGAAEAAGAVSAAARAAVRDRPIAAARTGDASGTLKVMKSTPRAPEATLPRSARLSEEKADETSLRERGRLVQSRDPLRGVVRFARGNREEAPVDGARPRGRLTRD